MGLPGPARAAGVNAVQSPDLRGRSVWVHVLGCRSNLCEGDFLAGDLEARGALVTRDPEGCSAAVIVSCSVTAEADRKCRQAVRRARRTVGEAGVVAVCGCWAQGAAADEARELGADILVGNRRKGELTDALEAMVRDGRAFRDLRSDLLRDRRWEELPAKRPVFHTRAFLKVQEGCDHFCSYCVIPFLRGRSVSRPADRAMDEARRLLDAGCREIVLTGIHLGMYGRDTGSSLAELVRALSALPGLERLRLGSLEPFALSEDLLEVLKESPVFCPHLHLPLQSGDDGVLSRMRRGYTADDFARLCDRARERLGSDLHISSDILVGFPGEDDDAFANTLRLMRRAGIGRAHVFPFSPRRGTLAEGFGDRVEPAVVSARAAEASALGEALLNAYAVRFLGRTVPVLTEGERRGGYTPHFLQASWDGGERTIPGRVVRLRAASVSRGGLRGWLA